MGYGWQWDCLHLTRTRRSRSANRTGDDGIDLYENEAMRTLLVLAAVAAATSLAAPAQADPDPVPDSDFLAALD
jgi:hypothetical protein